MQDPRLLLTIRSISHLFLRLHLSKPLHNLPANRLPATLPSSASISLRRQRHTGRAIPIYRPPTARTTRRRAKPLPNNLLRTAPRTRDAMRNLAVPATGVVELGADLGALAAAAGNIFASEARAAAAGAGLTGFGGGGTAGDVVLLARKGQRVGAGAGGVENDPGEVLGCGGGGEGASGEGAGEVGDGGVGGGGGGVFDAEGGGGEDCVCGISPEGGVVENGAGGVEDAAVGGFVDELQGHGFAFADLVAEVEGQVCYEYVLFSRGKNFVGGLVEVDGGGDVRVEQVGRIVLGTASAADGLHRSGAGPAAGDDGSDAGLVVHHFCEEGAGRGADGVGELDGLAHLQGDMEWDWLTMTISVAAYG